MGEYRFNVFGKPIAVRAAKGGWEAFYLGAEGKRRPADFIVPADVGADGLRVWLADLFHENATPRHPEVDVMSDAILDSVLTCPTCGYSKLETMPTDACQFYYECSNCKALLKPNQGDCCVFCSFGEVACPPIQAQRGCCGQS